jgi:hypothetical protein
MRKFRLLHAQTIALLDADIWQIFGMRMHLALGHGVIQSFLGTDRVAVAVIKLAVCTVNVDVPACLNVLVALD